jgi:hypothetical protein
MSQVYLEDGTRVQVIRFDISVTVHDYQTETTLWSGDVPQHLSEHYSVEECAEWATQWVDQVYGLPVESEGDDGIAVFGMLEHSYTEQFRAGARYGISVCVAGKGKGYTVTWNDSGRGVETFLSENEAGKYAYYCGPAGTVTLGTTEVTL